MRSFNRQQETPRINVGAALQAIFGQMAQEQEAASRFENQKLLENTRFKNQKDLITFEDKLKQASQIQSDSELGFARNAYQQDPNFLSSPDLSDAGRGTFLRTLAGENNMRLGGGIAGDRLAAEMAEKARLGGYSAAQELTARQDPRYQPTLTANMLQDMVKKSAIGVSPGEDLYTTAGKLTGSSMSKTGGISIGPDGKLRFEPETTSYQPGRISPFSGFSNAAPITQAEIDALNASGGNVGVAPSNTAPNFTALAQQQNSTPIGGAVKQPPRTFEGDLNAMDIKLKEAAESFLRRLNDRYKNAKSYLGY